MKLPMIHRVLVYMDKKRYSRVDLGIYVTDTAIGVRRAPKNK